MAGLQSGEGRMMIDLVVWAQYQVYCTAQKYDQLTNQYLDHWSL